MSADSASIVQLTTVHPRDDIRIAVKECATLAAEFPGKVALVVADGLGNDSSSGMRVVDLGSVGPSRLIRPFKGFFRVVKMLRESRPAIIHFHDPELIPAGLVAKALGVRVIYDVHEDVPRQILGRDDTGIAMRYVLAWCAAVAEWIGARSFDAIVCATPGIGLRFPPEKTALVQNFPITTELVAAESVPYSDRPHRFVYIGGITRLRGVREMMEAVDESGAASRLELSLAGPCSPQSLSREMEGFPGMANTTYHGWLDRRQVAKLLATARAGLVVLHRTPNHVNAQPIKLFEYMSAGLPVIASDFPIWREFVESTGSGILVDPKDPKAIRAAMDWIIEHPEEAKEMGCNGRKAIESRLNWDQEARKLISLYRSILEPAARKTQK